MGTKTLSDVEQRKTGPKFRIKLINPKQRKLFLQLRQFCRLLRLPNAAAARNIRSDLQAGTQHLAVPAQGTHGNQWGSTAAPPLPVPPRAPSPPSGPGTHMGGTARPLNPTERSANSRSEGPSPQQLNVPPNGYVCRVKQAGVLDHTKST